MRKKVVSAPKKSFSNNASKYETIKQGEEKENKPSTHGLKTLKKKSSMMVRLATKNLSLMRISRLRSTYYASVSLLEYKYLLIYANLLFVIL